MSKIGLGIVTCNREDFYVECLNHVPMDIVDELVTVNDGDKYSTTSDNFIQHETNKGVGISKNDALNFLIEKDCTHLFLIEDDILIKDKNVFKKYIEAVNVTGMKHFMYGYHGPANKDASKNPNPRLVVEYSKDLSIALNLHCVGAFCYYHKSVIDKVGLMDEKYKNAWEHVDHSYAIAKSGFIPAYWWWPDLADSFNYLDEQACSEEVEKGAIRKLPDWSSNIQMGVEHFISKWGTYPGGPQGVPETDQAEIINRLKFIKEKHGNRI